MTAKPFPTIIRRGKPVRAAIQRNEPLYAIIEIANGCEPEITHIVAKRLAVAYKRDVEKCKVFNLGIKVRLVPVRWTLGSSIDKPKTLAEAFGVQ